MLHRKHCKTVRDKYWTRLNQIACNNTWRCTVFQLQCYYKHTRHCKTVWEINTGHVWIRLHSITIACSVQNCNTIHCTAIQTDTFEPELQCFLHIYAFTVDCNTFKSNPLQWTIWDKHETHLNQTTGRQNAFNVHKQEAVPFYNKIYCIHQLVQHNAYCIHQLVQRGIQKSGGKVHCLLIRHCIECLKVLLFESMH